MSEEKPNVPKLRFPGFADPWEQRKFSDLFSYERPDAYIVNNDEYDDSNPTPVLTANKGFILGYTAETRTHEGPCVIFDDFTLDCKLVTFPFMVKSSAMKILHCHDGVDLTFAYERLCSAKIEALGHARHYISVVQNTESAIPSYEEQSAIGRVLSNLDTLITLHQRKLDHLKEMKKGLLQKMFPKNGESIPELRFPGFTDPWEQRKALHLASYSKGKGYSKDDLTESGTPVILYGRLYTKYESVIEEVDTFVDASNDGIYSHGDEVIVPASGETAEDIARASAVAQPGVLLGGDLNILRPNKSITSLFMALSLSNGTAQKELSKRAQGKSVVHVHNSDIQDVTISYPTIDEQTQIGAFFRSLDSLITLHQRKLDHLKQMKKGLLQQMFV